ncbi:hypothetical protein SOASR031_06550 [Leminorella grimontii]|nr:hypothetical protein SOASR031_06550 [Leminorella grimontii]
MLAGCAAHNDMANNDFPGIVPTAVPEGLVKVWTGSMGPYLSTMKIDRDGTGLYCYSWNGKDVVGRLKYDGTNIIFQDGQRMEVASVNNNELKTHVSYYMGADYVYYQDNELKNASPFCSKSIK